MDKITAFLTFEVQLFTFALTAGACLFTAVSGVIKNRHRLKDCIGHIRPVLMRREDWRQYVNIRTAIPSVVTAILIFTIAVISIKNIARLVTRWPEVKYPSAGHLFTLSSLDQPLSIEFDVPVDLTKLKINTFPQLPGEWKVRGYLGILPYGRFVTFRPSESYPPGGKIMVYLSNISKPGSRKFGSETLLEITVPELPKITTISPADGTTGIKTDQEVILTLSGPDSPASVWNFVVNPLVPFAVERKFGPQIRLRFQSPLAQQTKYTVTATRISGTYDLNSKEMHADGSEPEVLSFSFTTVKAPMITKFSPQGSGVDTETPITVIFDGPMDPESFTGRLIISPETGLPISWNTKHTEMTIKPQLLKNTAYSLTFLKGIKTAEGGTLEADSRFDFKTVGPVTVSATVPSANARNVPADSPLSVTFDQDVDTGSAEKAFAINPPVTGRFSWSGRTMTFTPDSRLTFQTDYTVSLAAGIKSIRGLDSEKKFEFSFTTSPERFVLNVPMYKQESGFTCSIAALRMLLAYRGIDKTENELVDAVGRNGYRGNGNPYLGYVSSYGTYWDPIAAAANKYRPSRLFKNWTLEGLLAEVAKGNPVMTWGQNGWSDPHEISWTNPDGTRIYAINGMHSVVVTGYVGPADNPTQILINDPWRGKWTLETAEFVRRWSYFKNALVVD